jgi:hypothetical protein
MANNHRLAFSAELLEELALPSYLPGHQARLLYERTALPLLQGAGDEEK